MGIDDSIELIEEAYNRNKRQLSENQETEVDVLMSQSFCDGMELIYDISIAQLIKLKSIDPQKEVPRDVTEFKAEVIKNMRKTIREAFTDILADSSIDAKKVRSNIHEKLMKLDKNLINQIASIRNELPK